MSFLVAVVALRNCARSCRAVELFFRTSWFEFNSRTERERERFSPRERAKKCGRVEAEEFDGPEALNSWRLFRERTVPMQFSDGGKQGAFWGKRAEDSRRARAEKFLQTHGLIFHTESGFILVWHRYRNEAQQQQLSSWEQQQ